MKYYSYINHKFFYSNKAINRYDFKDYSIKADIQKELEKLKLDISNIGNCELKTKIHFHSFSYKESKTKHISNIDNGVKKIKNTDKIDKLISDAFLKSSVKELEKAIKIYLENKEVYKEEADIWNEEKYYGRAKSIIENNSLNIQIERI